MMRLFLAALLAGVGWADGRAADDPKKVAAEARDLMKAACGRCHSGAGSSTPYKFDVAAADTLVKPVGKRKAVVVPGKPDESPLWQAIADERMPDAGSTEAEKYTAGQLAVVKKWIEIGAD